MGRRKGEKEDEDVGMHEVRERDRRKRGNLSELRAEDGHMPIAANDERASLQFPL